MPYTVKNGEQDERYVAVDSPPQQQTTADLILAPSLLLVSLRPPSPSHPWAIRSLFSRRIYTCDDHSLRYTYQGPYSLIADRFFSPPTKAELVGRKYLESTAPQSNDTLNVDISKLWKPPYGTLSSFKTFLRFVDRQGFSSRESFRA